MKKHIAKSSLTNSGAKDFLIVTEGQAFKGYIGVDRR